VRSSVQARLHATNLSLLEAVSGPHLAPDIARGLRQVRSWLSTAPRLFCHHAKKKDALHESGDYQQFGEKQKIGLIVPMVSCFAPCRHVEIGVPVVGYRSIFKLVET
jgi:hypothetical protein